MRQSTIELCHINLAPGFRGGERQTELLIRALAPSLPRQRLIARAGSPLLERLADVSRVELTAVRGRLAAVAAMRGARLVQAHETHGAQAALIRERIFGTPYVITRRVAGRPSQSRVTRAMYVRAARVVAVSTAVSHVLEAYEPALACAVVADACAGLTADPEWVRAFRARHAGRFVVGHIGAYVAAHKGQDVLLEVAARLRTLRPDVHFVFVGAGRDEAALRAAAAALPNVTLAGWADNVGDYLAAFDLFAFPSLHEGLGSILLDAMEFGLPIVANAVDGIPEIVEQGVNGLLVPPRDAAALTDAVVRLRDDAAERGTMAAANRVKAREFGAARMAERYLEVYAELAVSGAGRAR